MSGAAVGLGLVLALVAVVLVIAQVDVLQGTAQAATTGALAEFFSTPVFLVLLLGIGVGGLAIMAVVTRFFRL